MTSVSASDHLVVTGGLDKKLMTFDIRLLVGPALERGGGGGGGGVVPSSKPARQLE